MSRQLKESAKRLLAEERGKIYSPGEGKLTFALAFPNTYRLGMSSLGYQIVYGLLNRLPGVSCERVFLPEPPDIAEFERTRAPLFVLESGTPVRDFDVLGFSLSFELDTLNVLKMLEMAGLPLLSTERNETLPLVIAGGPYATFNPEPMSAFIDAFLIGEAEEALPELMDVLTRNRAPDREELLTEMAQVPGIYVPGLYTAEYAKDGTIAAVTATPPVPKRVRRRRVADLSAHGATSVIRTPNAEFSDMLLVEAIRGCGRQCRFCVSGYSSLPPRPRNAPPEGTERVGLVGPAVFDHPDAQAICERLTSGGRQFSVSSIRLETLTPELARLVRAGGQRTITIAPEAGTDRLRRVINKAATEEDIFGAVGFAAEAGMRKVKLYFMVGLPTETDEDVEAIADLAQRLAARHPKVSFHLSVSCFVPKPWTPFQWCGMADESALSAKLGYLNRALARRARVRITTESPRGSMVQALLARGDRRLAEALLIAHGGVGFRDVSGSRVDLARQACPSRNSETSSRGIGLLKAAAQAGLDPAFYITRTRSESEAFPWDHIDLLVNKSYLRREYCRAFEEQTTPPCGLASCARCGVC